MDSSFINQTGFEGYHYCESDMPLYQGKVLEIKSPHKHKYQDPKALTVYSTLGVLSVFLKKNV